jgi:hypothetical protein
MSGHGRGCGSVRDGRELDFKWYRAGVSALYGLTGERISERG